MKKLQKQQKEKNWPEYQLIFRTSTINIWMLFDGFRMIAFSIHYLVPAN